jgi:hypothetical protein
MRFFVPSMIGHSTKRFQKGYQNPYLNDEKQNFKTCIKLFRSVIVET